MSKRQWSQEQRDRVLQLHASGHSKRAIARELDMPWTTVRDILDNRPARVRRVPPERELTDVGVEWLTRFGEWPSSVTMNPTRASDRGGEAWRHCLEGRVNDQGEWKPWPQAHDMKRRFGSWDKAHLAFGKDLERRRRDRDPYVARPIPADKRRRAAVSGYSLDAVGECTPRDELDPVFPSSPDGPLVLPPAPARGGLAIIGDAQTGRSSLLAGALERDLLDLTLAVVVVQRTDKPSIAHGLPRSDLLDLPEVAAAGSAAVVESDDEDVRMMAIVTAAQSSLDANCDVSLVVDDAEDVVAYLARLLHCGDAPRTHVSAAWAPRSTPDDVALWRMLKTRAMFRIQDGAVLKPFYNSFNTPG